MYEVKESIGMWRLIGLKTNKVYFEAKTKAEVNRWRVDKFGERYKVKGTTYESSEPLRMVHVL